jgi:hypothetical protein
MEEGGRVRLVVSLYGAAEGVRRKFMEGAGRWGFPCAMSLAILMLLGVGVGGWLRRQQKKQRRDTETISDSAPGNENERELGRTTGAGNGIDEGRREPASWYPGLSLIEGGQNRWDEGPDVKDTCILQ